GHRRRRSRRQTCALRRAHLNRLVCLYPRLGHHWIRFFFLLLPPPPRSTLFPYTTLFRSRDHDSNGPAAATRSYCDKPKHRSDDNCHRLFKQLSLFCKRKRALSDARRRGYRGWVGRNPVHRDSCEAAACQDLVDAAHREWKCCRKSLPLELIPATSRVEIPRTRFFACTGQ